MDNFRKWLIFAPLGLSLSGLGLSLVGEANHRKLQNRPWFWLGTLGLCCVNAGIAVIVEAARARLLHDLEQA